MNDIMVDLETMGRDVGAPIVSIGAVQCNLCTGEMGEEFYTVVSLESNVRNNLVIDPKTVYWWMGQGDKARHDLIDSNAEPLEVALSRFNAWLHSLPPNNPQYLRLWGNGASFDNSFLRVSFKAVDQELAIPFWNDRDVRTLIGFIPREMFWEWKKTRPREGTYHNALADAKYQVEYCSYFLKELGVEKLY